MNILSQIFICEWNLPLKKKAGAAIDIGGTTVVVGVIRHGEEIPLFLHIYSFRQSSFLETIINDMKTKNVRITKSIENEFVFIAVRNAFAA